MNQELQPCPFCGAGKTDIHPNGRMWTGQRLSEPTSVSIRHWCEDVPGQPHRMIERVGRDEASAIAAWNRRAALAAPSVPSGEPVAWTYMGIKQDGTEHGPHLVWKPAYMDAMSASKGATATPLYTTPQPAPAGWQPIETAPKDGERILLVIDHGLHCDKIWTGLWAGDWIISYGKASSPPTHWMPLPAAPAAPKD